MKTDELALLAVRAEIARRNPDDPWAWILAHVTPHGHPLIDIPALADIARDRSPLVVVQKSAQVGMSETVIGLALWACDTTYAGRGHAAIFMPTADQMSDFAQDRVDHVLRQSAYLRARLRPIPPQRRGADNRRVKHIGEGTLFMRGSESARQVASIDADLVILDEYDQMSADILERARRRLASSRQGRMLAVSTPRYPEAGVNALFLHSDQRHYYLTCAACGEEQTPTFVDNIDRSRMLLVCKACAAPLNSMTPGRWIPHAPGNTVRGYFLPRVLMPWLDVAVLVEASEATSPSAIQEFQNSDLGEVFSPPGGGLSLAECDAARRDYGLGEYAGQTCAMGVDVGTTFHVVVRELPPHAVREAARIGRADVPKFESRLWYAGEVGTIHDVEALLSRFNVETCIIDGQPETHLVRELATRQRRAVRLARYRTTPGHERTQEAGVRWHLINRVEAMDATFQSLRDGGAVLPRNARELGGRVKAGAGEYIRELMAPKRLLERDTDGNFRSVYVDHDRPDHYAHAEVYCRVAADTPPPAQLSVMGAGNQGNRKTPDSRRSRRGRRF